MTRQELQLLKSLAKQQFLAIPQGVQLDGKDLQHGDRLALAYFEAAVRLLIRRVGPTGTADLLAEQTILDAPDSDPETEDADWIPAEPEA